MISGLPIQISVSKRLGRQKKNKSATTNSTTNLNKTKKKKKQANDAADLQNLVIGGSAKPKPKNNSNNSKSGKPKEKQWDEWQKNDSKYVSESYQQDLQEALLQSKIDYEEKKPIYDMIRKDSESDKKAPTSDKKKKKLSSKLAKPATLSLEQFQNLLPSQIEAGVTNESVAESTTQRTTSPDQSRKTSVSENDFFDKFGEDAEKIAAAEQRKDHYKKNQPIIADHARSLELTEILEKKDKEVEELKIENEKLKSTLKETKQRNRKLCNILAQGEFCDTAEILVQNDRLIQVRDELAKEVSDLNQALEQERSKVHSLQTELKKQGSKKEAKDSKNS